MYLQNFTQCHKQQQQPQNREYIKSSLFCLLNYNIIFSNLFISNYCLVLVFIHYHIVRNMQNRHTVICTQKIPKWNRFAIFPLFICLNFFIFFLCVNYFSIKGQYICQYKTNGLVLVMQHH